MPCHSRCLQPPSGSLGARRRQGPQPALPPPFRRPRAGPPDAPTRPHATASDPMFGHIAGRMATVTEHFPAAMSAGDFLSRVEVALGQRGLRGDNSIAVTNLCRDEATALLKDKIDAVFGATFNINGLGAGLSCGCLGLRAGFSHSPVVAGRERYIFFSMPHIAIDSAGRVGSLHRPGQHGGPSTACGALFALLSEFKGDPRALPRYAAEAPSSHAAADPEISMLRNRLARFLVRTGADVAGMYLSEFTQIAERAITTDLEDLIQATVDISTADYAVVTGVQIHSWPMPGSGAPLLEFVAPRVAYAVCNGARTNLNLQNIPALTPRQLAVLRRPPGEQLLAASAGSTVVVESKIRDR
eukprot:jgi/Ulvmu1/3794/UM018_0004.1